MSDPIALSAVAYNGPHIIRWERSDRNNIHDPGMWSGFADWVAHAQDILGTRRSVVVLQPNVVYNFELSESATFSVEAVAAAMIGAVAGRADITSLLDELPATLVGDFADDDTPTDRRIH